MKILIDARLYGLENAGLGRYVMNLVDNLLKIDRRNSYTVLLGKKYFNRLNFRPKWNKVLADFTHYGLAEQIKLPRIISELKPDIVHFPHFNVPFFYSGSFVVTIHDILMHKNKGLRATTLPAPEYYLKRLGYKTVFRHAVTKALKIIVPSNFVKKELVRFYRVNPAKIIVTYEGFDAKISGGESPEKVLGRYNLRAPFFIYAGNAYPHKNLERLVEAILQLNQKRDEKVLLAIASARSVFTERLEKMIKKLGAGSYVRLLGFIPDADLGILYQYSLGFTFPSLSEGFGLPGLEAVSCGTLLLASDIPVFEEVYKTNAVYFNPYDFTSIEKTMQEVLEMDVVARREKIEKAKEFAKRYSWDKMARETLKVYEGSTNLRQG